MAAAAAAAAGDGGGRGGPWLPRPRKAGRLGGQRPPRSSIAAYWLPRASACGEPVRCWRCLQTCFGDDRSKGMPPNTPMAGGRRQTRGLGFAWAGSLLGASFALLSSVLNVTCNNCLRQCGPAASEAAPLPPTGRPPNLAPLVLQCPLPLQSGPLPGVQG